VSIFAWKLLRNGLSTKTNLAIRGIIPPEAQSCVTGCGDMESAQHLLSLAASSALFDRQLGLRSACPRWIFRTWLIILFSLLLHLVVSERVAFSFSFFDSCVSGLFETKEINDYSETQNNFYLSCWTRSNFILTGDGD
jgi:hypothetical protein